MTSGISALISEASRDSISSTSATPWKLRRPSRISLLVFSGCYAPAEAGPLSEPLSYWMLAERYAWWGFRDARARSTIEDFALDSLQNLVFAICRFREFAGAYPREITVPGWGFKRRRFVELHRAAIRFPPDRFHYVGVNEPPDPGAAQEQEATTYAAFAADPYGSFGALASKRRERDSLRRRHGYGLSCPELSALLAHRGPAIFRCPLPWN